MAHNLLTRRRLIGAAGLAWPGSCPGRFERPVKPAFRWQDEAAGAAAPDCGRLCKPSIREGTRRWVALRERFLYYLGQNIHYLVNYRRALSALAKRLKNPAHRRQFEAWAEETAATERYTRDCFIRANPKQLDVLPISPTTQLYMGWEAQAASFLPVHEAVGAMLPCFWSYGEVGRFGRANEEDRGQSGMPSGSPATATRHMPVLWIARWELEARSPKRSRPKSA